MFSTDIDRLSYRQIQNELRKRQLNSNGKKIDIIKRLKLAYQDEMKIEQPVQRSNITKFHDLPNEIYCEIFDYLCSLNILQSFSGINHRLNEFICTVPMKLNLNNLSKSEYKRLLKQTLVNRSQQIVSIELGQLPVTINSYSSSYNSEIQIDLFTQSYNFTQFSNLRCLSLTSASLKQLESIFTVIPHMFSLRLLRLFEQDYYHFQTESICKLTLANKQRGMLHQSSQLTHISIETNPPFKILILLHKHFHKKMFFHYIHINIRCSLFYHSQALKYFDCHAIASLISDLNCFKIDIIHGTFTIVSEFVQCFPQIKYLSIKTSSQAYANGYQWAELLQYMSHLLEFNLNICFDSSDNIDDIETFKTKFWLERRCSIELKRRSSIEYEFMHRDKISDRNCFVIWQTKN